MTSGVELMAHARELLAHGDAHSARMACWLARAALEEAVSATLSERGIDVGDASMRSRISCLQGLDEAGQITADRIGYAWSRLSSACHQHAYELSPTAIEATQLLDSVNTLLPPQALPPTPSK